MLRELSRLQDISQACSAELQCSPADRYSRCGCVFHKDRGTMCVPPLVFITKGFSGSSICCPHCVLNQGAVLGFFNHSLAGVTCLPCWLKIGLSPLSEATLKLSHKVLNKPLAPSRTRDTLAFSSFMLSLSLINKHSKVDLVQKALTCC